MKKDTVYGNKLVRKKDYDRSMEYHLEHIRNAKPITRATEYGEFYINNRKKQYQNQQRFTQIQRQNRILLTKITSIMQKPKRSSMHDRANRSLNSNFRKKQMQDIQIQNARFLKRLQQKRSTYETQKLNKQWERQKQTMKIMSNFPFMLQDRPRNRRVSLTQMQKKPVQIEPIQMVRVRVINGMSFLITIQLTSKKLRISGQCKQRKQIKVIQIQRRQAIQFIEQQCLGRIQLIFDRLKFDSEQGVLYLVGNSVNLDDILEKENQRRSKNINQQNQQDFEEQHSYIEKYTAPAKKNESLQAKSITQRNQIQQDHQQAGEIKK